MTAEEVTLAPPRKDLDGKTPSEQSVEIPEPISFEELSRRLSSQPTNHVDGLTVVGDVSGVADLTDVPLRACCRCLRLNLKEEKDRATYADLLSRASVPGTPIEINWEERVVSGDALIVYLTYIEYFRVSTK